VMPPATESVMSVVPRDRGGAGSAITNISRQVAVALGVAVLGSILSQAYRARLGPYLSPVPSAARHAVTASISATQAAAQHLGAAGERLLPAANDAFVHAMHITSTVSAIMAIAGAIVIVKWMPGRPALVSRALPASNGSEAREHGREAGGQERDASVAPAGVDS
jgi:DHA2 family multidrug resistance protein-like MFS transporter